MYQLFHEGEALRANISETGLVLLINEQGEKEEDRDEREFSWCCSFPWGFGCRGTERRLASWRAAAQCSGSQSGRRFAAGFAAGSGSGRQTKRRTYTAEYKQRILQEAEVAADDARRSWRSSPPRRSVLVSADLLAARAGQRNPRGADSAETRAEVQAPIRWMRRSPEAAPPERPLDRRSA